MSNQDSEYDINVDNTQHQESSHTPETLQNNTTMHDKDDLIHNEYDTSEDENITEIETFEHYGEKLHETEESIPTETSQILTVFNKTIHHEDDSSDDKSEIEIEPPKENGEQDIGKQDELQVEGLINKYSNSRLILEITKNCGELILSLHYMN